MSYYGDGVTRINSTIGKTLENIKVEIKRLRKDLKNRSYKNSLNIMDEYILEYGEEILKKGEDAIGDLKEIDYIEIIKRSMKRNEICLGRVDEGNLRVLDNIEIGTLKNISYNLVEEDVYEYLKRVRRRSALVNSNELIDKYIELSHLNKNSEDYIRILLKVPYDTLRQWYRYKYNKRGLSPEEYLNSIKASFKYEKEIF